VQDVMLFKFTSTPYLTACARTSSHRRMRFWCRAVSAALACA
jgi:hypothetical protein